MNTTTSLKNQWEALKVSHPTLRIRNAAEQLGVSEAELVATQIGETVTRLQPEFASILSEIESLGKVMALTRNEACVHERKGTYLNADFSNPFAGLFVGDDIYLRILLSAWDKAYAVIEPSENGTKKSLQFFGKDGLAIHKIFLTPSSNEAAFDALVTKFKAESQEPTETIIEVPMVNNEQPDG